jgi:hypothetical protein
MGLFAGARAPQTFAIHFIYDAGHTTTYVRTTFLHTHLSCVHSGKYSLCTAALPASRGAIQKIITRVAQICTSGTILCIIPLLRQSFFSLMNFKSDQAALALSRPGEDAEQRALLDIHRWARRMKVGSKVVFLVMCWRISDFMD